jgi:hypothetical protein
MMVWARVNSTLPSPAAAISTSVSQTRSAPSSGSPSARKNSAKRQLVMLNSSASSSWRSMSKVTSRSVTSASAWCIAAHFRRGLPSMSSPMAANSCFDQSRNALLTIASALPCPSSARRARITGTSTWAWMWVLSRSDNFGSTKYSSKTPIEISS